MMKAALLCWLNFCLFTFNFRVADLPFAFCLHSIAFVFPETSRVRPESPMPNTAHTKEVRRESAPRALSRTRATQALLLLAAAALSIAGAGAHAQKKPAPKPNAQAQKARASSAEKGAPPARAAVPTEILLQIIE